MVALYVPVGPPASGKSAMARKAVKTGLFGADAIVCPAEYRWKMTGDRNNFHGDLLVFGVVTEVMRSRFDFGCDVWLDDTNTSRPWVENILAMVGLHSEVTVTAILFDTPLEECLRRNVERGRWVPETTIETACADAERLWASDVFDGATKVTASQFERILDAELEGVLV